ALDLVGRQLPEPDGEHAVVEGGGDGVEVGVVGEAELPPEPAVGPLLPVPVVAAALLLRRLLPPPLAADPQHPVVLHLHPQVLLPHPRHVHHDLVRVAGAPTPAPPRPARRRRRTTGAARRPPPCSPERRRCRPASPPPPQFSSTPSRTFSRRNLS
ncbi:Os04g0445150, partial [Oryza sativa Japonica Group]